MTFSIMALSIMAFSRTINKMRYSIMKFFTLVERCDAECHFWYLPFVLSIANKSFMLSVLVLNVIKLSVIMQNVVAPWKRHNLYKSIFIRNQKMHFKIFWQIKIFFFFILRLTCALCSSHLHWQHFSYKNTWNSIHWHCLHWPPWVTILYLACSLRKQKQV